MRLLARREALRVPKGGGSGPRTAQKEGRVP